MEWFIENRKDLTGNVACMKTPGEGERRLLSIVNRDQLRRVLRVMLDENEFLSRLRHTLGVALLTRRALPLACQTARSTASATSRPNRARGCSAATRTGAAPSGFPVNFLIIESLQKFHHYLGDDYKVECPTGSGQMMTLWEVAAEISQRLTRIFLRDDDGRRPVYGGIEKFQSDPHWRDLISVLRILSRRQRRGHRREPSDRLDRPRGKADSAERRIDKGQTMLW